VSYLKSRSLGHDAAVQRARRGDRTEESRTRMTVGSPMQ
jgi:hypothetical protein